MRKKKICILTLISILLLSFLIPFVNAATSNSFTASMTAKNPKVPAGSEVLITVKLSNLNVGENGINGFSAYLSYDTEVFEPLTDSSVDGVNGWVPSYTTGTGKVSLYRPTFLKTDEEIMQISLKTKADLTDGTQGEVKLSTIKVSNSSEEMVTSPVSTSITIGKAEEGGTTTPTPVPTNSTQITPNTNTVKLPANNTTIKPIVNNTVPQTSNNNSSIITPNTNKVENTASNNQSQMVVTNESDSDIPYTGTDSNALARVIIGVIFIGLALYIKIERMNKDIR